MDYLICFMFGVVVGVFLCSFFVRDISSDEGDPD